MSAMFISASYETNKNYLQVYLKMCEVLRHSEIDEYFSEPKVD